MEVILNKLALKQNLFSVERNKEVSEATTSFTAFFGDSSLRIASFVETGRWTKEEHVLFIEGLTETGGDWQKMKEKVKTRSADQIRSHAQKYFKNLEQSNLIDKYGLEKHYGSSIQKITTVLDISSLSDFKRDLVNVQIVKTKQNEDLLQKKRKNSKEIDEHFDYLNLSIIEQGSYSDEDLKRWERQDFWH